MSYDTEWPEDQTPPCISCDLIRHFLARAHAFTTVGLEVQASGFSYGPDGVIKYLALLPQVNGVDYVDTREGEATEYDAMEQLKKLSTQRGDGEFHQRCWIHTHPRCEAFMSAKDLYQLYVLTQQDRLAFGIVVSPRMKGVKALCVRLTPEGF